ncbi:hypothetical protein ACQ5SP_01620 [Rhodovulum sp. YNF3179]|uniref:hypothetical protein n=1 Tax=Rhodovulum sp. YNF3179 TaxID=3425127 RepID=UPI003D32CB9D
MMGNTLREMAERIEDATMLDAERGEAIIAALRAAAPEIDPQGTLTPDRLLSTDAVIDLVDRVLPGWAISMDGTASRSHGHWTCTLRMSGVRDNDAYLGVGHGPRLPLVLLAALLRATAARPAD